MRQTVVQTWPFGAGHSWFGPIAPEALFSYFGDYCYSTAILPGLFKKFLFQNKCS